MSVDHVKSTGVSNAENVPVIRSTTGEGAIGYERVVDDYVTVLASSSVGATYRIVRLPTTCKVKAVILESEAQAAGKVDVGVFYPITGKTGLPDLVANAISAAFFASAVDLASAVTPTNIINESGTNTLDKRNQPLWQAVGLTSDPGGYFDIVASVITTPVTTGTGKLGLRIHLVD